MTTVPFGFSARYMVSVGSVMPVTTFGFGGVPGAAGLRIIWPGAPSGQSLRTSGSAAKAGQRPRVARESVRRSFMAVLGFCLPNRRAREVHLGPVPAFRGSPPRPFLARRRSAFLHAAIDLGRRLCLTALSL